MEMDKSGPTHALFRPKEGSGKTQTLSSPALTPNHTKSIPDDKAVIPRTMQSMGIDFHPRSGTSKD